jgi:hypothetical protein
MSENDEGPVEIDWIIALVGSEQRPVDFDLYHDEYTALADKYRKEGLTGSALDDAIHAALPLALASAVRGVTIN